MTEKYYAVLMTKKKIDTSVYCFIPIKLIEGKYKEEKDNEAFIDSFGLEYPFINDSAFVLSDSENGVGYKISKKELLKSYEKLSIEEACSRYYDEISSCNYLGFVTDETDKVVIAPLDLIDIVNKLSLLEEEELDTSLIQLQLSVEKMTEKKQEEPTNLVHLTLNYFDFFSLFDPRTIEDIKEILENLIIPSEYENLKKKYREASSKSNNLENYKVEVNREEPGIDLYMDFETFFALYETKDFAEILNILNKICPPDVLKDIKKNSLPIESGQNILDFYNEYYTLFQESKETKELKIYIRNFAITLGNLIAVLEEKQNFPKLQETKDVLLEIINRCNKLSKSHNVEEIKIKLDKIMLLTKNMFAKIATTIDELKFLKLGTMVENTLMSDNNIPKIIIKEEQQIPNVMEMKSYLDKNVIGQEEAKKAVISTLIMNKLTDDSDTKNVCMLIGPTGSGKTLIAKTIAEYYDVPFYIADTTQLTSPGYVGGNIEDILKHLLDKASGNQIIAEKGIIVLNEIDKKGSEKNEDVAGKGVLNTFLPLIEGTTYDFSYKNKSITFNTKDLTFIATGAFENVIEQKRKSSNYRNTNMGFLMDKQKEDLKREKVEIKEADLIKYGLMPAELIGRISNIIQLEEHTRETLKKILTESLKSPLLAEQQKLAKIGIYLTWDEEYLDAVVEEAFKLNVGGRSLKKIIEKSIMEVRWEALYYLGYYKEIKLSKNTVINPLDCELVSYNGEIWSLKEIRKPSTSVLSRSILKTQKE